MKFGSVLLLSLTASVVQAFAPVAFTRGVPQSSQLFSDKPDSEEEGGLDLDLEEMFEM